MRGSQLGFLVAASLLVAACGSTSGGTAGTGGTAGVGGSGGTAGVGGSGGTAPEPPVDQCVNDADQAIFDDLGAEIGEIAAGCGKPPSTPCGGELGLVFGGDRSERAITALSDCVAQCISDQTDLSTGCTSCYGLITTCAIGACIEECGADPGSAECSQCSLENCSFFDACLGI